MGFWDTTRQGHSFAYDGTGIWGDSPADAMDDALEQINATFKREAGRSPTLGEIRAGLEFSLLKGRDDQTYDEVKG